MRPLLTLAATALVLLTAGGCEVGCCTFDDCIGYSDGWYERAGNTQTEARCAALAEEASCTTWSFEATGSGDLCSDPFPDFWNDE